MKERQNLPVLVGASVVLAGMFFGWFGLRGSGFSMSVTGWGMLSALTKQSALYYLLYLVPLGILTAGLLSLVDRRSASLVAVLVSGGILAWGAYQVLRILYATTFFGVWISLVGCFVMLIAGLASLGRE